MSTLTVPVSDFSAALGRVIPAADHRPTFPILSHVRLQTSGEKLGLTCTDNEIEVTTTFENASMPGLDVSVPARKLHDVFRTLPRDAEATIEVLENTVEIRCGRSKFSLNTLPAQDFPTVGKIKIDAQVVLSQALLSTLFTRVEHALATRDVRAYLNGMLLEIDRGVIRVVATDGHRLALCEHATDAGSNLAAPVQVLIPRNSLIELEKLIAKDDGQVEVAIGGSHARFTIPGTRFYTRLLDAKFPDYRRVIPNGHPLVSKMGRDALAGALTRAKIMADDKTPGVVLDVQEDMIAVSTRTTESLDSAHDEVLAESNGQLTVAVNTDYLLDAIRHNSAAQVDLLLKSPVDPLVIEDRPDDLTRVVNVIMPLKL